MNCWIRVMEEEIDLELSIDWLNGFEWFYISSFFFCRHSHHFWTRNELLRTRMKTETSVIWWRHLHLTCNRRFQWIDKRRCDNCMQRLLSPLRRLERDDELKKWIDWGKSVGEKKCDMKNNTESWLATFDTPDNPLVKIAETAVELETDWRVTPDWRTIINCFKHNCETNGCIIRLEYTLRCIIKYKSTLYVLWDSHILHWNSIYTLILIEPWKHSIRNLRERSGEIDLPMRSKKSMFSFGLRLMMYARGSGNVLKTI